MIRKGIIFFQMLMLFAFAIYSKGVLSQNSNPRMNTKVVQNTAKYAKDRVIVRFKSDVNRSNLLQSDINSKIKSFGVKSLKRHKFSKSKGRLKKSLSQSQDMQIDTLVITDKGKSVKQVIKMLNKSGLVEYAEPDYQVSINVIPSDPRFNEQWGLHNIGQQSGTTDADIDAVESWDTHVGNASIVVGVIDTGVDYTHEDLVDNMWVNTAEIPGNNIDDDANGYIDDIHGLDCFNNDGDPMDDHNHGTHVAGTIGARGNNGIGVSGVNWDTKIMALKFLDSNGSGDTSGAIECLNYAIMMKNRGVDIRVTNNSWGGSGFNNALRDAILAAENAGMLFVAAAGNSIENTDEIPHYPSTYDLDSIISVASTDRNDAMSRFSSYGFQTVDLGAPGSAILSTYPGNNYGNSSGTSMASPHVAGAVTLLWSQNPSKSAREIKNLILDSADPIPALDGKTLTGARLNIFEAVGCVPGNLSTLLLSPQNNFIRALNADTDISVQLTDCGVAINAAVITVTPDNAPAFQLLDNGVSPDLVANDGIYSATWTPQVTGAIVLTISISANLATDSIDVSGNIIEAPSYTFNDQIPFNWIDATSGNLLSISSEDDAFIEVPLGFDFDFYNLTFDMIKISTNGYLTFGNDGRQYSNSPIPSSNEPNNLIAAFWDDLNPSESGNIYTLSEGIAPKRRLTIQWHELAQFPDIGLVTFQATLYEGSNNIVFRYLDVDFGDSEFDLGNSATIGIESDGAIFGLEYSSNEANIENNMSILFTYNSSISLPNNSWFLMSLPHDPGTQNTVSDIFSDILDISDINRTWAMYEFDAINNRYIRLNATSTLDQHSGYWIKQNTGQDAEFYNSGTTASVVTQLVNPNCPSVDGCFELELFPPSNTASGWNLIGDPFNFEVTWKDIRIEVDGIQVCTPAQAYSKNIMADINWHFNGTRYIGQNSNNPADGSASLEPLKGYWLRLLSGSQGKVIKLLIPKGSVSDSPSC